MSAVWHGRRLARRGPGDEAAGRQCAPSVARRAALCRRGDSARDAGNGYQGGDRTALACRAPEQGGKASAHGEDQSRQPRRRTRRRRDDPHHLAADQGQADPPLPRRRPRVLRPRRREPRRHQRQGDGRRGRGDQEARRRRQVRHHHPRRGAGEGIQPQEDVEVAERHDPQHPRRRDLPRADHLQERAAPGARLDPADRRSAATPSATSTAPPTSRCPARAG